MSADKDRGIRRQKQKRAKQRKKMGRQAQSPVATPPETPAAAAAQIG